MKYILYIKLSMLMLLSISCSNDSDKYEIEDYQLEEQFKLSEDPKSIHFFVIGDWGFYGNDKQMSVKYAMNSLASRMRLDFIISVGDNFQDVGPMSENDPQWKTNYDNVYNDSSLLVPWYVALGNHDHYGNADAQVRYTNKNRYWKMPARYFIVKKGLNNSDTVKFIILDTESFRVDFQKKGNMKDFESNAQYQWFKNELEKSKDKWVIVVGHHPVYSGSLMDGDVREMKIIVKPLLDKYKVDLFLCGHDHDFEHAKDPQKYTDYIVSGTGGTNDPANYNERTIFTISKLGFTYFTITSDVIRFSFIILKVMWSIMPKNEKSIFLISFLK